MTNLKVQVHFYSNSNRTYSRLKTKVANLFECEFCNGQANLHPAISNMAAISTLISILVLCVAAAQLASIGPGVLAFYWSIFALTQSKLLGSLHGVK